MLMLTRKVGERVQIGEDVVITVVEVRGGRVRLGIYAPNEVPIYREEILEVGTRGRPRKEPGE